MTGLNGAIDLCLAPTLALISTPCDVRVGSLWSIATVEAAGASAGGDVESLGIARHGRAGRIQGGFCCESRSTKRRGGITAEARDTHRDDDAHGLCRVVRSRIQ